MGNDMVGQVIEAFKKVRPERTVMKIWNYQKAYIILGVKDPDQWEYEMDPYYMYIDGKISGISYLDNAELLIKALKANNLIYVNKLIEEEI